MLSGALALTTEPVQLTEVKPRPQLAPLCADAPTVKAAREGDELHRYGSSAFFLTRRGANKGVYCAAVNAKGEIGAFFELDAQDARGLRDDGQLVAVY